MILIAMVIGLAATAVVEELIGPLNYGVRGIILVLGTMLGVYLQGI